MQRSGRTSLTRPTCYRRTLAQVIERGYPSIRMTANGLARPCSAPRHGHPNAWHIGLELANVALTQRDLHRSLLGVREKSLIRKCSVNPRSSPEITKNRHFRVRVLHGQPRSRSPRGQKYADPKPDGRVACALNHLTINLAPCSTAAPIRRHQVLNRVLA